MRQTTRSFAGAALLALSIAFAAPAGASEPLLTLSGAAAGEATASGPVALDLAALDAMPQTAFRTTTPWHQGTVEFSGVTLKDYLAALHAKAEHIRLVALNDYAVDADVAELVAGGALLATRQDGKTMPVSDKGPVFLLFPFDSDGALRHQSYYSRSVW